VSRTPAGGAPSIGWSRFAWERHRPGTGHTWFDGTPEELLALIRRHWPERRPGTGRRDLNQVVIVPVPPDRFHGTTVLVDENTPLHAAFERRQPGEEGFISVRAEGEPEPVRYAGVVLYSAETLLENGGERSGPWDWEVVCLLASPVPDEPMDPVTMARNMLGRPGGTPCRYTAEQFAEAVWYWSRRARRYLPPSPREESGTDR